jgi:hypothetical protein
VFRTGSAASRVTDEGWQKFEHHLGLARQALTRAWEKDPGTPYAAARMLTVCQGQGSGLDEARLWLQRALTAQLDCVPAWLYYFNGRLPRWGGSLDLIEAAAEEMAGSMRWDTNLPYIFEKAASFACDDRLKFVDVLTHPRMSRAWAAFLRGIPSTPSPYNHYFWHRANHWALFSAWDAERVEDARGVIDRQGWVLNDDVRRPIQAGAASFEATRIEIIARSGPMGGSFSAAESSQSSKQYELAATNYQKLAAETDGAGLRDWLNKRVSVARIEGKWENGDNQVVTGATFAELFFTRQGGLKTIDNLPHFSAAEGQHAVACIWLSSRSTWELEATFDLGSKPDATTGLFFGHRNSGRGIAVLSPRGWVNIIKLKRLTTALEGDDPEGSFKAAPVRVISARWDGRELSLSGKIGDTVWNEKPITIEADPGIWMLALTAAAKQGPLEAAVLRKFELKPLRVEAPPSK